MWANPLTIALVAASAAILGSLLTIFLTPALQHHFWRKQRRDELRLATINEFNRLTSDFILDFMAVGDSYVPSRDWFKEFTRLSGNIKVLFSEPTFRAFKTVEEMIGPGLGPRGKNSVDGFIQARDVELRALHAEVIPLG